MYTKKIAQTTALKSKSKLITSMTPQQITFAISPERCRITLASFFERPVSYGLKNR